MLKAQMGPKDFLFHKQDEKGNRHSFFDFKKFSNFIEEEEDEESDERKDDQQQKTKSKLFGIEESKSEDEDDQRQ